MQKKEKRSHHCEELPVRARREMVGKFYSKISMHPGWCQAPTPTRVAGMGMGPNMPVPLPVCCSGLLQVQGLHQWGPECT